MSAWPTATLVVLAQFNRPLDNSTQAHYMLGMIEPDNLVSLAEWKQRRMQAQGRVQAGPVYTPVRDLDGRWQLELTGTTTLEPELHFYVDPS